MFFTFQVFPLVTWEIRDLDPLPWSAPCLPSPLELTQVLVTACARSDKVSWLRAKQTSSQENSQQVWILLHQIGGFFHGKNHGQAAFVCSRGPRIVCGDHMWSSDPWKLFEYLLLHVPYIHMYTQEKEHRGSLSLVPSKWKMPLPITPSWTNVWGSLHSFSLGIASLSSASLYSHMHLYHPVLYSSPIYASSVDPFTSLHNPFLSLSFHQFLPDFRYPSPLPPPSISLSIPPYVHPYLSIHSSLPPFISPSVTHSPPLLISPSLYASLPPSVPVFNFSLHPHPSLYFSSFPVSIIPTFLPAISHQPITSSHCWVATTSQVFSELSFFPLFFLILLRSLTITDSIVFSHNS